MILFSKTKTNIVNVNDTRPISLLSCFSKLYEKIFLSHFCKCVTDYGILSEEQTGVRIRHNMAVRLVSIIDQIGQSLTVNAAAAGLFIDFQTAFNQLWFNAKAFSFKLFFVLDGMAKTYLSERSAFISISGTSSGTFCLYKGVPQGSCVGPVIFIVYHHDILKSISVLHWKHLLADDLAVIVSSSANWSSKVLIPNLIKRIKTVILQLMSYASMWKQPINFQKTFWVLFHNQVAPIFPQVIDCNGHMICHCNKIK